MRHRTTQIIYGYWNEARHGRLAPRRFDIEPARIAGILAETTILEQVDEATYRFRLAGTRITEQFATELRGRNFLDLWSGDDRHNLSHQLASQQHTGGVLVITFDAATASGRVASYEAILLPLYHTRDVVDRYLGAISCASPPMWLGSEPLERLTLTSSEMVWPDGRPHPIAERMATTPALNPTTSTNRIVRLDRRQFRVFNGGRSENDNYKP